METAPRRRLSFQAKVLLPVIAALVLLPVVTLWILGREMERHVEDDAAAALATADSVFQETLEFRSRELLARFRFAVNESSYRSIASVIGTDSESARNTVSKFLDERLVAMGEEIDALMLTAPNGTQHIAARGNEREQAGGWRAATSTITERALHGEVAHGFAEFGGYVLIVVAVPLFGSDPHALAGALTVAAHVDDRTLQEMRMLTGAEVVMLSGNNIAASSFPNADIASLSSTVVPAVSADRQVVPVEISGERYLALMREQRFPATLRYILLSSYERRLQALAATRRTLVTISAVGTLLAVFGVWLLIRRITQPLLELRDRAEAVGRGDFTQKIERFSNDECGDLAEAFNRMTTNLQGSRVDLEKAVGTLRSTEQQLIQSEKLSAVGQFVSGIAHELNNPLTAVIGFSELLQRMDIDATNRNYLEQIAKNAVRCHKIVHSLLGFARQHEPERKLLRINEVVDAVIEIVAYDMRTNNVAVERSYGTNLPPILGDAHQLQQVILNILSNARQALESFRRDGRIVIRTGSADAQVWLRIKDNGPGIRPDVVHRIFDPFFTTKPQGKGTGLGLSLSYGIIQEHRGTIRVESKPGEGAEFIIAFPIAATAPAAVAEDPAAAPALTGGRALRVLIVDDEDAILNLVQAILVTDGHQVHTARSGQEALDRCTQARYDVIVSDWKMPGLNGMQIHEDLLSRDPTLANRMLFMTGDVVSDVFQEFLKKHSRACLPKPFSLREFRAALDLLARGGKPKPKTSSPFA